MLKLISLYLKLGDATIAHYTDSYHPYQPNKLIPAEIDFWDYTNDDGESFIIIKN